MLCVAVSDFLSEGQCGLSMVGEQIGPLRHKSMVLASSMPQADVDAINFAIAEMRKTGSANLWLQGAFGLGAPRVGCDDSATKNQTALLGHEEYQIRFEHLSGLFYLYAQPA